MYTNAIKALIVFYLYSGYTVEIGDDEKDETEILANDTIIGIIDKFGSETFEFEKFVRENAEPAFTFIRSYYEKAVNCGDSEPNEASVGFKNAEIMRFIVTSIAGF